MSERFSGQVALVAGGTGGLGRAVSLAFLQEGATVAVTFRKQEEFDALKKAAGANGSRLAGHAADVTDEASMSELVGRILAQHGKLDALVNTVGGYAGGAPLWDLETKVLDQMPYQYGIAIYCSRFCQCVQLRPLCFVILQVQ